MKALFLSLRLCLALMFTALTACGEMLDVDFDLMPAPKRAKIYYSANLVSVEFGHGRLYPALNKTNLAYIGAPIPTGVDVTTIKIIAESSGAVIELNGSPVEQSIDIPLNLNPGSNPVTVTVTAEDSLTVKTYTIDCYRAIPVFKTGAGDIAVYTEHPYEDSTLQKGVAWPSPRFLDNSNGTVTDNMTGLIWVQDAGASGTKNWVESVSYCEDLTAPISDDWRLPNREELRSLINYGAATPGVWLDSFFTSVGTKNYFSASLQAKAPDTSAWMCTMLSGIVNYKSRTFTAYAWPVRGSSITIPVTGQILPNTQGYDGYYREGQKWPTVRFVDNKNGTMTDVMTGLTWTKQANLGGPITWQGGLNYVNSTFNSGTGLSGHKDWRIPNVNEIASLMNSGAPDISAWLLSQGFQNIVSEYWSSTTCAATENGVDAWYFDAGDTTEGALLFQGKGVTKSIWAVRGPDG
jgi:hypothetical protein